MRIHTNALTSADLRDALKTTGLRAEGVALDFCTEHASRSRARGLEFRLEARPGRDRFGKVRTRRNTGSYGAEDAFSPMFTAAATYAEHGVWMAELYERDPDAIVGYYKSREHYHRSTRGEFATPAIRASRDIDWSELDAKRAELAS